jgi:hypothetical protein
MPLLRQRGDCYTFREVTRITSASMAGSMFGLQVHLVALLSLLPHCPPSPRTRGASQPGPRCVNVAGMRRTQNATADQVAPASEVMYIVPVSTDRAPVPV